MDDLFLSTPEFVFDGGLNEGDVYQRCTGEELSNLLDVQNTLNAQYSGSTIITEFAMNGGGIAEQVRTCIHDHCIHGAHSAAIGNEWCKGKPWLRASPPTCVVRQARRQH